MRDAFIQSLIATAQTDSRVVLLTGDLGFSVLEPFAQRFPDRFYNVGVAEQNMVGIATGLAEAGFIPFAYSIATFASMRPYEFIRNGPVLHRLPVRIVGVGGGFDYGQNGATHYALEDIGILRVQPDLTVVVPADDAHARSALAATYDLPGPIYYRISKSSPALPGLGEYALARMARLSVGDDIAIIACGPIATEAVAAAELLAARGVDASVSLVSSFGPGPVADLVDLLSGVRVALSVEAHFAVGGLGSFVAEVIADHGLATTLRRCAVDEMPRGHTGSQQYLQGRYGIGAPQIAESALAILGSVQQDR